MSQTTIEPPPEVDHGDHVVWYRNVSILRIVGQLVAVIAVVGLLAWLFGNLTNNLARRNIGTDFGFLTRPTNFQVPYDEGFDPRSSVFQLVVVGVRNTFLAGIVGIIIASILGMLIGIARLSSNWLIARLAMVYVEVLRNIPPLVIIIFFGAAIFTNGPFPILSEAQTVSFFGTENNFLVLSNDV
ncbi:MAG: ABC transporter permease subunit, partial [Acidimicrobiia bacterium]|nr:ABC transporter permease subunit [Acidimicrobiia bacterium]